VLDIPNRFFNGALNWHRHNLALVVSENDADVILAIKGEELEEGGARKIKLSSKMVSEGRKQRPKSFLVS
jgi:hypothetical protein